MSRIDDLMDCEAALGGDPDAVLAAAAKSRRRAQRRAEAKPAYGSEPAMPDLLFDEPPTAPRRKPKRVAMAEVPAGSFGASAPASKRARARVAAAAMTKAIDDTTGMITRMVKGGLDTIFAAEVTARRFGVWGAAAGAAIVMVIALSVHALLHQPPAAPVAGLRVDYLPGPQLPPAEIFRLLRTFPGRDRLNRPDDLILADFAAFLRDQVLVAEVGSVRIDRDIDDTGAAQRVVVLSLRLREPEMPAVFADGQRVWIDHDGRVLPGILPAPAGVQRPMLRGLEVGGADAVREALAVWRELEPKLEPGIITEIHLHDALDLKDQRGLVLYTRWGGRVIWGRPADDCFGVDRAQKARDLVHTLRCQGDLARVETINVRFRQPVFTLRR